MVQVISTTAEICGILGFIISLFAINGVIKIKNTINKMNNSNNVVQKGNTAGGDIVGGNVRN